MARTLEEIEQLIDDEANGYTELAVLQQNSSMAAFWRYTKKVVAFVVLTLEIMFDKHKEEVNSTIEKTETGSLDWYLAIAKEYQHGDNLIVQNNRPIYSSLDEEKQIIKRVAVEEDANAVIFFKLVKEDNTGFVKLDDVELSGASSYLSKRKIAGTKIIVESFDANILNLQASLIVDGSIMDDAGALLSDPAIFPVLDAINDHLINYGFGLKFYLSKLTDKVMDVPGVIDFHINASELDNVAFNRSVDSSAGYIKLDNGSQFTYVLS